MDTIAPLVLSRAFRAVWIVGLLGIVLSATLALWFWREARRLDQIRFEQITHRLMEDLDTQTEKIETMLRDLARVLSARPEPALVVWDEFMNQVAPAWNFPGVIAIGYATNHDTARVLDVMQPWLRDAQPKGRLDFYLMPEPLTNSRRWSAWIVEVYRDGVEPMARFAQQEKVSSFNNNFQKLRFQGMQEGPLFEAACPFSTNRLTNGSRTIVYLDTKTNPLQDAVARDDVQMLKQSAIWRWTNGVPVPGATMLVPVADPRRLKCWEKLVPESQHFGEDHWLRWQLNAGLIFAYLDFPAILTQIQGKASPEVEVEIYTKERPTKELWLNPRPGVAMRAGSVSRPSAFERLHTWPMYSSRWGLFFYTTPIFDQQSTRLRAWWAGGMGLIVTTLFCRALAVQTRGRLLETQRASELKEARDALQGVQRERERLSHDLHDGAIQSLYAIQLGLTRAGRAVEARAPDTAHTLQESRANLDTVIGELRGFITEMKRDEPRRPSAGLAAVLDSIVRRLRPASTAHMELECDAEASDQLTSVQALQLAAIAREALSNSLRHARAQKIRVQLTGGGSMASLEIIDDGVGFNVAHPLSDGMGLKTMKRRAADIGSSLVVRSAPNLGTRIHVQVPITVKEGVNG
jgi:signal transduction histidine kinase